MPLATATHMRRRNRPLWRIAGPTAIKDAMRALPKTGPSTDRLSGTGARPSRTSRVIRSRIWSGYSAGGYLSREQPGTKRARAAESKRLHAIKSRVMMMVPNRATFTKSGVPALDYAAISGFFYCCCIFAICRHASVGSPSCPLAAQPRYLRLLGRGIVCEQGGGLPCVTEGGEADHVRSRSNPQAARRQAQAFTDADIDL